MIRLVVYVALLTVIVAGAVWFASDPGAVVVMWRGWRLDTSVGILLLLIAALVAAVLAVVKVISLIRGTSRAFVAARRERRVRRGLEALGDGLAAVHAGDGQRARRLAKDATALLDDNPATLVLATHAAATAGDAAAVRAAATALLARTETELAGLRELATRAAAEGDVTAALEFARRALARKDAPRWAFDVVLDIEIAKGNWAEALAAVDSKNGRALYTGEAHRKLKARLLARVADQLLQRGDTAAAVDAARKAIANGAGGATVGVLARALAAQGKKKKAAAEIEKAWSANAGPALLAAYRALAPDEAPLDWAKRVERLVAHATDDAESRLAVAEASVAAELWGQARNRLMPLLGDEVSENLRARAAVLMAEIESAERGDTAASIAWLKRAVTEAKTAAVLPAAPSTAALLAAPT